MLEWNILRLFQYLISLAFINYLVQGKRLMPCLLYFNILYLFLYFCLQCYLKMCMNLPHKVILYQGKCCMIYSLYLCQSLWIFRPIVVTSQKACLIYLAPHFVCGIGWQSCQWSSDHQAALLEPIEFYFWLLTLLSS